MLQKHIDKSHKKMSEYNYIVFIQHPSENFWNSPASKLPIRISSVFWGCWIITLYHLSLIQQLMQSET